MREISFRHDILPLKDKLYRLALRITLDTAEAEDIVQDTLIKVWNLRGQWPELDSVEAFCLTVARNLAIDRSQKAEARNSALTPETQEIPDALAPDERMERDEQLAIVHRLISELPERQRTILHLREIEGKSYKEMAELLHLTEEQVKVNLFRARQRIKQKYDELNNYGL
ncbi:MAG: RNA polymerase sigma factor [Bacteroidales bacterium]|nr:RNA polymerase sigma factor [Bacteroidales bacterium]